MITKALLVRLEAKPGQEQAVEEFLTAGLEMTNQKAGTPIWFAIQLSPTTFGVFDAFASEEDRRAHLAAWLLPRLWHAPKRCSQALLRSTSSPLRA